jgi:hypothetical protein
MRQPRRLESRTETSTRILEPTTEVLNELDIDTPESGFEEYIAEDLETKVMDKQGVQIAEAAAFACDAEEGCDSSEDGRAHRESSYDASRHARCRRCGRVANVLRFKQEPYEMPEMSEIACDQRPVQRQGWKMATEDNCQKLWVKGEHHNSVMTPGIPSTARRIYTLQSFDSHLMKVFRLVLIAVTHHYNHQLCYVGLLHLQLSLNPSLF